MTDAELVALAIARVGSTARLADLMWIESRNLRRYASGEKPLSPVKRAKLEALVTPPPRCIEACRLESGSVVECEREPAHEGPHRGRHIVDGGLVTTEWTTHATPLLTPHFFDMGPLGVHRIS